MRNRKATQIDPKGIVDALVADLQGICIQARNLHGYEVGHDERLRALSAIRLGLSNVSAYMAQARYELSHVASERERLVRSMAQEDRRFSTAVGEIEANLGKMAAELEEVFRWEGGQGTGATVRGRAR